LSFSISQTLSRLSKTVAEWEAFFDTFKEHLAPIVYDAGPSLTVTDVAPTVHPEQTAWARQMRKAIYMPVEGRVYVAVGYQLCSPTMVVGDDGVIIIDPGFNDTVAGESLADLRRFTDLPVKAVVYTHRHPDHCFAIGARGHRGGRRRGTREGDRARDVRGLADQ
jgi:hypothetical protein